MKQRPVVKYPTAWQPHNQPQTVVIPALDTARLLEQRGVIRVIHWRRAPAVKQATLKIFVFLTVIGKEWRPLGDSGQPTEDHLARYCTSAMGCDRKQIQTTK